MVLWTSAGAERAGGEARRGLRGVFGGREGRVACCEAPADMSKANGALAAAMGVTRFPTCQAFRGMKARRLQYALLLWQCCCLCSK